MADLPEDFVIDAIPNRSDDRLNTARIGCAFSDMPNIFEALREQDIEPPVITDYCVAIIGEAVSRGASSDLYSAMQPGYAVDEWQRILAAGGKNQSFYDNAEEIKKELPCELAFDAGYVFGHRNPNVVIADNMTDENIADLTKACFDPDVTISTLSGLAAGARTAQAKLNAADVSNATLGERQPTASPDVGNPVTATVTFSN